LGKEKETKREGAMHRRPSSSGLTAIARWSQAVAALHSQERSLPEGFSSEFERR